MPSFTIFLAVFDSYQATLDATRTFRSIRASQVESGAQVWLSLLFPARSLLLHHESTQFLFSSFCV